MLTIEPAYDERALVEIRRLFDEYIAALGFHLTFQDVERELAELPGRYSPPAGRLLLARANGPGGPFHASEAAGCVAMKRLAPDICEMKRFFVRPVFRGKGIGLALAKRIVEEGRAAGYARMRLDTAPSMQSAVRIYEALGFKDTAPYVFNPVPGVRYFELDLTAKR